MKTILVTGASGYIGSVICKFLKENGYTVVACDVKKPNHNYLDSLFLCSFELISDTYLKQYDSIFHLAASADVPDSIANPMMYYDNNTSKTISFINKLTKINWRGNFIFSSTAAVYGNGSDTAFLEASDKDPINPYGRSKLMCEEVLYDSSIKYIIFRYFNVIGAYGNVGDHLDSNHVIQRLCNAALNNKKFNVYGHNLNTRDGSCVRDYIHVLDIVRAHLHADGLLDSGENSAIYNIGSNHGTTVLELIESFNRVNKTSVEYVLQDKRPGDPDTLIANPEKIESTGFSFKYNLDDMLSSAWVYYYKKELHHAI